MAKPKTLVDLESVKTRVDNHEFELNLLDLSGDYAYPVCFEGHVNVLIKKSAHTDYQGSPNLSLRIETMAAAWGSTGAYYKVTHSRTFGAATVKKIHNPTQSYRTYVYLLGGHTYQVTNYNLKAVRPWIVRDSFVDVDNVVVQKEIFDTFLPSNITYESSKQLTTIDSSTQPTNDVSKQTFKKFRHYTVPLLNGWQQTHAHRPITLKVYDDGWIMFDTYINGGATGAYTPILELPGDIGECSGYLEVYRTDNGDSTKMIYPEGRYLKLGIGFENANNILVCGWIKASSWQPV